MRVLVTGVSGFLGSHLTDRLLREGHTVIGVDNLSTGDLENLSHLRDDRRFAFKKLDICEPFDVGPVDYVFNMASPASPPEYLRLAVETLLVGSAGTKNALDVAKRYNAGFLHASTSECYGDPLEHPQSEEYWGHVNPVGPRSVYDEAKRYAEALVMAYHRYYGVNTHLVRIFNTYGPRLHPSDGRVISNFMMQALRGEPLTIYGSGEQTRSFCYVDDLIDGIWRLSQSDLHLPVNIGNPTEFTILQCAETILEITGSKSELRFEPLPQDDPTRRCPNITQARTKLGWEPKISLRQGLLKSLDFFTSKIEKPPVGAGAIESTSPLYASTAQSAVAKSASVPLEVHGAPAPAHSAAVPKFSLIVPTIGRADEIEQLFDSLTRQGTSDFEVIVVDQNPDDRLKAAIDKFSRHFSIVWQRCPSGASRARNFGLRFAKGQIIAFPDDDCWYSPNLLKNVGQWFDENPAYGILATGAEDESGVPSGNRWIQNSCDLHPINIFRTTFCSSLFIRNGQELGSAEWDQKIGPGSKTGFSCGDETDYILQLMSQGLKGRFDRRWHVGHPRRDMLSSAISHERAVSYGKGMGYVLSKHSFPFLWLALLGYDYLRVGLLTLTAKWEAVSLCLSHASGLYQGYRTRPRVVVNEESPATSV